MPAKRKVAILREGMTHADARATVAAAWPGLELTFWHLTEGYRRDGSRHDGTATDPTDRLAACCGGPVEVRVVGPTTFGELCKSVYAAFGVVPELTYPLYFERGAKHRPDHATVTRLHREGQRHRGAFAAEHGREPTHADRLGIEGDGWFGFGDGLERLPAAGPPVVVARVGMTCGAVEAAFRAAWPHLRLSFYRFTSDYSRNGRFAADAGVPDEHILAPAGWFFDRKPHPLKPPPAEIGTVRITGGITFEELSRLVSGTFGLEVEIEYRHHTGSDYRASATLADLLVEAERQRQAFVAAHGREPTRADAADDWGWVR